MAGPPRNVPLVDDCGVVDGVDDSADDSTADGLVELDGACVVDWADVCCVEDWS